MNKNLDIQLIPGPGDIMNRPYFTINTDSSNEQHDIHTIKSCKRNDKNETEVMWSRTFVTKKYTEYNLWYYEHDDLLYLRRVKDKDYRALTVLNGSTGVMIYTRYGQI